MVTLFQRLIVVTCLLTGGLSPLAIKTEMAVAQVTIAQANSATQAQQLFDEGMQLYKQGSVESLQQAIAKWQAALLLRHEVVNQSSQQAIAEQELVIPSSTQVRNKSSEAITLVWIGRVYSDLGEKQKALDYYNKALLLYTDNPIGEAATLNNIGRVYDDLGEKQKALDYYSQSLFLLQALSRYKTSPVYKIYSSPSGEPTTLNNIGRVHDDLGEKQKALDYYSQALPLYKAVGDRDGEADTLNNIGRFYDDLGEKQKALDYYSQALPLYKAVGDRRGEAATLNNIGVFHSNLKEKQKALDYYSQALLLRKAVGDRRGEAATLRNIASLEVNRGNLQAALTPMQNSIAILEDLRIKIISSELRQSYFATVQSYYQLYIDLLMQLHQQNPEMLNLVTKLYI